MNGLHFIERLSEGQLRDLHRLYQGEWWTRGRDLENVRAAVSGSDLVFGVAEDATDRLVAFARVLTDGVFKAFIFDLIVDPSTRGQEIGRALMERLLEAPRVARVGHVELYCLPELVPFYEKWGFSTGVGGVLLMRRSS